VSKLSSAKAGYWRKVALSARAKADVSRMTAVAWSGEAHIAEGMRARAECEMAEADAADCVADAYEEEG
jgi:hypothetical protein